MLQSPIILPQEPNGGKWLGERVEELDLFYFGISLSHDIARG